VHAERFITTSINFLAILLGTDSELHALFSFWVYKPLRKHLPYMFVGHARADRDGIVGRQFAMSPDSGYKLMHAQYVPDPSLLGGILE
jgi:hypothetical protein